MNAVHTLVASVSLVVSAVLAGCGPKPSAEVQPAQASAESFTTSGNYELHYNALRSDQLSAAVAQSYGIERSKNKVMLNLAVLRKEAGGGNKPVDAAISVNAHNLNGQVKDLQLRRIAEGEAIYYIGDAAISGTEILVFEISAVPNGETAAITAKFNREFFSD
jgi:hypothetical protein